MAAFGPPPAYLAPKAPVAVAPALPKAQVVVVPSLTKTPALPATTKAQVDLYLAALSAEIRAARPARVRSCIISGALRCGKTLIAREVCKQAGMVHIPSDRIRNATYVATEGAERARLIKYIYKRLLLTHPKGLVLDGTVFVDHGVTLPMWARARRFKVFVIGYANGPAQRKARSILKYRRTNDCWTDGKLSEADILHISRQIVSRSRDLRAYCEKHALVYFDVDSGRFDMELRRVTRTILRRMRVTVAGGHSTAGLGELGPIEGGPRAL